VKPVRPENAAAAEDRAEEAAGEMEDAKPSPQKDAAAADEGHASPHARQSRIWA
jgi:hypothetical protein